MAKEERRPGVGGKSFPIAPSPKAESDSGPAGERSTEIWVNERGETCIGNRCFSIAIREGDEDVVVRIDRNECGQDMLPIVEVISAALGRGGRTLWETTSLRNK